MTNATITLQTAANTINLEAWVNPETGETMYNVEPLLNEMLDGHLRAAESILNDWQELFAQEYGVNLLTDGWHVELEEGLFEDREIHYLSEENIMSLAKFVDDTAKRLAEDLVIITENGFFNLPAWFHPETKEPMYNVDEFTSNYLGSEEAIEQNGFGEYLQELAEEKGINSEFAFPEEDTYREQGLHIRETDQPSRFSDNHNETIFSLTKQALEDFINFAGLTARLA